MLAGQITSVPNEHSRQLTMATAKVFRYFDLPLELRDQIREHLHEDITTIRRPLALRRHPLKSVFRCHTFG